MKPSRWFSGSPAGESSGMVLRHTPRRIGLIYAIFGALWILLSDWILLRLIPDPVTITIVSSIKGWIYVFVSALLIYVLVRRSVETITKGEERYQELYNSLSDLVFASTLTEEGEPGLIVEANAVTCRELGYDRSELVGMRRSAIEAPERVDIMNRYIQQATSAGHMTFETILIAKDHRRIPVEVAAHISRIGGQRMLLFVGRDISQRKQAEDELRRAHRALRTVTDCNHIIARAVDEPSLLAEVCRLIVFGGGYRMAWIGMAEDGAEKLVRPVAQVGYEEGYLESLALTWGEGEQGMGPAGTAIRTGRPVVAQNIHGDPQDFPLRAEAMKRGYSSLIAMPIRKDNQAIGALTICALEPDAFDTKEIKLITELAEDLSSGIRSVRLSAEGARVKAALQASEERLRFAMDGANDGLWDVRMKTGEMYLSARGYEILGYRPGEKALDSRMWNELVHPADMPRTNNRLEAHLNGFTPLFELEQRLRTKSGGWKWVMTRGKVVERDAAGAPIRMTGTHTDISERKRAEEALQASERLFESLAKAAPVGIFRLDAEGNCLYVNERWCEITGLSSDEARGKGYREVIDPEPYMRTARDKGRVTSRGQVLQTEHRIQRRDGTVTLALGQALAELDEAGIISGYVGTLTDITGVKKAEEALRHSEERFKAIFQGAAVSMMLVDEEGRVLETNQAMEDIFGYTADEFKRLSFAQVSHPADRPAIETHFAELVRGTITHTPPIENRYLRKDGGLLWGRYVASAIRDAEGRFRVAVAMVEDISAQKDAKEQLVEANRQLHALSARLQQVREEERTWISREIHDELGQALTGLKIDLSWMLRKLPEGESALRERCRSMQELLDATISTVQKISSELRPGMLDELGLSSAIEWQAQEFQNRSGIRCIIRKVEEIKSIDRDRATAIFRIFQETLTNVARHANASVVDVHMVASGDDVLLTITDNGEGIKEEKIRDSGSIGLIGMKERARAFDGTLTVTGRPGFGTTVEVRVPRAHILQNL